MVNKLKLATIEDPRPDTLQCLEKGNEVTASKQALVAFLIRKHRDEVTCDILSIGACHLFLGRPWQYDRDVTHHGQSNTYSFKLKGKKMILTYFAPS